MERHGRRRDPGAFRLDHADSELVDLELEHHLALRTEELIAQGYAPVEARRMAEEAFGDLAAYKALCHDEAARRARARWRREWPASLLADMRYALRGLSKAKGYAVTVVLTLALGIGANAAIFTVVDAMLLKPIPYPEPDGLYEVEMWHSGRGRTGNVVPLAAARALNADAELSATVHLHVRMPALLAGGEPVTLTVEAITPGLTEALGVEPSLGRSFTPEDAEPGAPDVVVVGHDFWRTELAADPSAVGRTILLDDRPVSVVGVMPREFRFPHFTATPLWLPLRSDLSALGRPPRAPQAFVRAPAGSLAPVAARLAAFASRQRVEGTLGDTEPRLAPMNRNVAGEDVTRTLWVAIGAALIMFLVALVNGVNLSMARATTRVREIAVRLALGGSRARVVTQLFMESLVLSLASALAALGIAYVGVDLLLAIAPDSLTYWAPRATVEIDARVLGFAAGLALLAALAFGLLPAARAVRSDAAFESGTLRMQAGGSRRGHSLRASLIVVQVAASVCLLFGAGLLGRSFYRIVSVDLGFEPAGLVGLYVQLPSFRYPSPEARAAQLDRIEERLATLPGVVDLARSCCLPPGVAITFSEEILVEGADQPVAWREPVISFLDGAGPDLRRVLGIELLAGRDPLPSDDGTFDVLVSEGLARRLAPGRSAVDLVFRFGPDDAPHRVTGVIDDVKWHGPGAPFGDEAMVYLSEEQSVDRTGASFAIRTDGDARSLLPGVRSVVAAIDPNQPIGRLGTMEEQLSETLTSPRFFLTLMAVFAVVALVLAGLGLYGLLSFWVGQRRREIGIRVALGAGAAGVRTLVIGSALRLTGLGLIAGTAISLYASRALQELLFETSRTDGLTLCAVGSTLLAAAALASYVPARRATSVDPMEILRHE